TTDASFAPITSSLGKIHPVGVTSMGKVLVRGKADFNQGHDLHLFDGSGAYDSSFADAFSYFEQDNEVLFQDCDKIIVSGYFSSKDGGPKHNMVRYNLLGETAASPLAPFAENFQELPQGATLADIAIDGDQIQWYAE